MIDLPVLSFSSMEEFAAWIEGQPDESPGLWLRIAKKGSSHSTISYDDALTVALSAGWIDGVKRGLDDDFWLQRFTPRRATSRWSEINRAKAMALIESGRMRPRGQREVDRAKADGRWDAAYAGQRSMVVPPDLQRALDDNPAARTAFDALDRANRFAFLYRINDAKRAGTRERRIQTYVAMLAAGERLHP